MAWPLASQNVLAQGSFYISMAFAGQLGRDALSAAVLGTSILNVTGFAALAGLASAMETLCGQVLYRVWVCALTACTAAVRPGCGALRLAHLHSALWPALALPCALLMLLPVLGMCFALQQGGAGAQRALHAV